MLAGTRGSHLYKYNTYTYFIPTHSTLFNVLFVRNTASHATHHTMPCQSPPSVRLLYYIILSLETASSRTTNDQYANATTPLPQYTMHKHNSFVYVPFCFFLHLFFCIVSYRIVAHPAHWTFFMYPLPPFLNTYLTRTITTYYYNTLYVHLHMHIDVL